MKTLQEYKAEQMRNPEFAKEYNSIQAEMDVIREKAVEGSAQNLTQKEFLRGNRQLSKVKS